MAGSRRRYATTLLATAALLLQASHSAPLVPLDTASVDDWTTQQWDVIVIGAGPAGIIVADRMSEAGKKTLLLEQGGPSYSITGGTQSPDWLAGTNLSRVDVPGLYSTIFGDQGSLTCGAWVNAFGGCTIGGSSAINAGLFFQPPDTDWDRYFPAGWRYNDVLPAIARLNARQPSSSVTSVDGQLYLQDIYQAAKAWLVGSDAGYQETDFKANPNAVNTDPTFGHPVYDYYNGQRGGPVTTYLQTALARPNFSLQSGVRVKYITHSKASSSTPSAAPTCPASDGTTYTDSNGVTYKIYCGQDNSVLSYTGIYVNSGGFDACFALCSTDTARNCGGFSFVGNDAGYCYLRNSEGGYTPNAAVISAYRSSSMPPSPPLSTATGIIATVNGIDTPISLSPSGGRVVVSGGALMSPQILMWSGIGDASTLSTLQSSGILATGQTPDEWVLNAAVGAGLFDNPNTFIELRSPRVAAYRYNYSAVDPLSASLYTAARSGPYAFAGQLAAFWDSRARPDGGRAGFQGTLGSAGYQDFTDANTVTLNVYGTSGLKSRGRVVLDGRGVAGPSGDVYYSDPQDAEDIAGFIRGLFDALVAEEESGTGAGWEVLNMQVGWNVSQIGEYITTPSPYARGEVNHWSSSCSLNGTCADVNAQIVGTTNIHVVDASILAPLSVNPQMGVMIAAEHASERILSLG